MIKLESKPIKSGSRARKIWKYISRIERLENRFKMQKVLVLIFAISDTLDYLEELGVNFRRDRDGEFGYYWDEIKKMRYEIQPLSTYEKSRI